VGLRRERDTLLRQCRSRRGPTDQLHGLLLTGLMTTRRDSPTAAGDWRRDGVAAVTGPGHPQRPGWRPRWRAPRRRIRCGAAGMP